MMSKFAVVSYRLGLTDGVSVEAAKWAWALRELGHSVVTVAGAGVADVLVDGLGLDAEVGPDVDELSRAMSDADVVLVENVCSLPINRPAADAVAALLGGRRAIMHHHDLALQRPLLAHLGPPPDDPQWRHVTINQLSQRLLAEHGIDATVITNHFDMDPPAGNRDAMRSAIDLRSSATLLVHPVRAIPRKDVAAALRLAERLGAVYWLIGGAEDGFAGELATLLNYARTGVRQGVPPGFSIADVYAASDVVVLSSTWEGFGNAAIESVAFRRPLARRRYPVMAEIERHGLHFFDLDAIESLEKFVELPDTELLDENVRIARQVYDLALLPGRLAALLDSPTKTDQR
jgi:glycosyltransferase involved in cell wall biosynthesis